MAKLRKLFFYYMIKIRKLYLRSLYISFLCIHLFCIRDESSIFRKYNRQTGCLKKNTNEKFAIVQREFEYHHYEVA